MEYSDPEFFYRQIQWYKLQSWQQYEIFYKKEKGVVGLEFLIPLVSILDSEIPKTPKNGSHFRARLFWEDYTWRTQPFPCDNIEMFQ